jgi:hypothetical protein
MISLFCSLVVVESFDFFRTGWLQAQAPEELFILMQINIDHLKIILARYKLMELPIEKEEPELS